MQVYREESRHFYWIVWYFLSTFIPTYKPSGVKSFLDIWLNSAGMSGLSSTLFIYVEMTLDTFQICRDDSRHFVMPDKNIYLSRLISTRKWDNRYRYIPFHDSPVPHICNVFERAKLFLYILFPINRSINVYLSGLNRFYCFRSFNDSVVTIVNSIRIGWYVLNMLE